MKTIKISKVEIQVSGEILLCLENQHDPFYQYIYREAAGVYWNQERAGFESRDAYKMPFEWWYLHIVSLVKESLGVELVRTQSTKWVNVPIAVKSKIEVL